MKFLFQVYSFNEDVHDWKLSVITRTQTTVLDCGVISLDDMEFDLNQSFALPANLSVKERKIGILKKYYKLYFQFFRQSKDPEKFELFDCFRSTLINLDSDANYYNGYCCAICGRALSAFQGIICIPERKNCVHSELLRFLPLS